MGVEDTLPPGETVRLRNCPWYVVPRKQSDGSLILWDGDNEVYVRKHGSIQDGIMQLERLRRLKST